ncbi:hypothetical protein J2Y63_002908 [Shinella sp. BE166]|uniref:DUF6074 family protein n=1 Tax=Shinella sp. BE166 TaxID=3373918 RepID=UPI003EBFF776
MTHQATIIPFPVTARVRKIRDTALKLLERPTVKSAEHYRGQVLDPMRASFLRIGLSEEEADEQTRVFWMAVQAEAARLQGTGVTA